MDTTEILTLLSIIISCASLLVTGVLVPTLFFMFSRRVSIGGLELQIRNTIREANTEKQSRMIEYESKEDGHVKKFANFAYASAIEWYLNSFEDACGLALDKKIDRTRFRKTYYHELEQIIKNKKYAHFFLEEGLDNTPAADINMQDEVTFNKYLNQGKKSKYPKIFHTYIQWRNEDIIKATKQRKKAEKQQQKEEERLRRDI